MTTLSNVCHRFFPFQQLLMLGLFVGITVWVMPLSLFVYDNDEGINVMKALLMAHGHPLYTATWSDQPPVFTQLLALIFALFGVSMTAARLLVLALATLFVWAYTSTIRLHLGTAAAWLALLLLMLSDNFLRLSLSVMIGLPALSFAMVAIYLLQRSKRHEGGKGAVTASIIGSGLLMAMAIQTKVIVILLVPVVALDLLEYGRDWWRERSRFWYKMRNAVLFVGVTLLAWIGIGLYCHAFDLDMLLGAHLSATVRGAYEGDGGWPELSRYLLFDYGHLLLALAGTVLLIRRRQWHGLLPLAWLLTALLLLINHSPIWYHHYPLAAIPICWLAAYLVPSFTTAKDEPEQVDIPNPAITNPVAVNTSTAKGTWAGGAIVLLLVLGLVYTRAKATIPYYNQRGYDQAIMTLLQQDAAQTTWLFADQAIYPFYAGLQVPPEIAVFSRKRFYGASLDNQMLVTILDRYQPEGVLLTRFKDDLLRDPQFVGYLNAHYTTVAETAEYGYYRWVQ